MKRYYFLILFLSSCGTPDLTLRSLSSDQPRVLQVTPDQSTVSPDSVFVLSFSTPLQPETVSEQSVLLTEGEVSFQEYKGMSDFMNHLENGKVASYPVHRLLSEDGTKITVSPTQLLKTETSYSLVVTSRLLTPDGLSFNQTPSDSATPFLKLFRVTGATKPGSSKTGSPTTSGTTPDPSSSTPPRAAPVVVINEVSYDVVGSDTDGVLFIELKGVPGEELSGLQILFINGDDGKSTDTVLISDGSYVGESGLFVIADSSNGSTTTSHVENYNLLDNFDPQNGPDAVQLVFNGDLLDVVAYGPINFMVAENGLAMVETTSAVQVASGHSLSRFEGGADTNNNSTDFVENTAPSPGTPTVVKRAVSP
ncbi:MAG: Ig-like domain-containing protein [Deltaproteobacteria bacterium]|nr:Ig-like domain-containing protein [Deltaproteobacteria bacterium]